MEPVNKHFVNEEDLALLRHSAAHVLAQAVVELFPSAKLAIGPAIADGFYYDFDLPRSLTPEDLGVLEGRMREIIGQDLPFLARELPLAEAETLFAGQPYKLEIIRELGAEGQALSVYAQGPFVDLCRGPHVARTGLINPAGLKLLKVAGAYWKGDESRPMLQRIYGTAWGQAEELQAYLERLEELEARDHRRINKQMDLFTIPEEIGGGLVIYGPKAGRIRAIVEEFWRQEHFASDYDLLYSPHIGSARLWEISGHLENYRDGMYAPIEIDEQQYYLKPMNCPFHLYAYKAQPRSYRDLPIRYAELGTVYRYERSGTLHGLLRTRGFTQDDAHIICAPEQMEEEIYDVLQFSLRMWEAFGFHEFRPYLSTRPAKSIGSDEQWERATAVLRGVLEKAGLAYKIDEGGGVFYGPKIDMKIEDSLGREWQNTTIQFDFNLPERFNLVYTGKDGLEHRPYMVHRALLGSWERFFGLLIEHYAGAFPVWLCPVQVQVIPVADRHLEYAQEVKKALARQGVRVKVDASNDRMQAKIRRAQLEKIPYMAVVGDREVEQGLAAVRLRSGEDLGPQSPDVLAQRIRQVAEAREGL